MESYCMVAKFLFSFVAVLLFITQIIFFRKVSYTIWLISLCMMFWATGKALAFWIIGPSFVRWYMADMFFVPGCAYMFMSYIDGPSVIKIPFRKTLLKSLSLSWLVAIAVEMMQTIFGNVARLKGVKNTHGGDIVDVIIFTVVFAACAIPLLFSKRNILP